MDSSHRSVQSKRLMVNINACARSSFPRPVSVTQCSSTKSNGMQYLSDLFGKIKVTTNYLGYSKQSKVKGFVAASASKTTFYVKETKSQVTVEEYFRKSE